MNLFSHTFSEFFLWGGYSVLAFFLAFFVPGSVVLYCFGAEREKRVFNAGVAISLGIVLWGLQGFVFGYLNLRGLTFIYLLLFSAKFLMLYRRRWGKVLDLFTPFFDKWLFIIILFGLPLILSSVFLSGIPMSEGVWFYGINRIDGSYHIAVIRSILRGIAPEEPGLSGELIRNYHYWSDLVVSEIVRVFRIPVINLFYQYFPFLVALLYGGLAYIFAVYVSGSKIVARVFAFLIYFSGNWGYLLMFVQTGKLDLTVNSLDNSALIMTNPPRVLAQIILLLGSILVYKWIRSKKLKWGILAAVVLGVTVGFKVYVGIFAAFGMVICGLYWLVKRQYRQLLAVVLMALTSMIIFFPVNSGAGGIFWSPFSWPRHFFAEGTASQLMWHLQEDEFRVHNNNLRIAILYAQMTLAFIGVTMGARIFGVFGILRGYFSVRRPYLYYLALPTVVFIIVPVFFLQHSGIFEVFNFLAVSTLFMAFFTALFISYLLEFGKRAKLLRIIAVIFSGLVLVSSLARVIKDAYTYFNYYKADSGQVVSWEEMSFYEQVDKILSEESVVLTDDSDALANYTPYLSAFAGARMYYSGGGVLRAHGLDVSDRDEEIRELFSKTSKSDFFGRLDEMSVDYLYLTSKSKYPHLEIDESVQVALQFGDKVLYKLARDEESSNL